MTESLTLLGAAGFVVLIVAVFDSRVRFASAVLGAALVFGSGATFSLDKIAVAACWVLCLLVPLGPGARARRAPRRWTWNRASEAAILALGIGVLSGVLASRDFVRIGQDSLTYGSLVLAALAGSRSSTSLSARQLDVLALVVGVIGTYAFVAYWLAKRGLGEFPTFGTPSGALAVFLVSILSARASRSLSARAVLWWAASFAVIALVLLTGTRTMLALLLIPPICLVLSPSAFGIRLLVRPKSSMLALVAAPLAIASMWVVASRLGVDTSDAFERVSSAWNVFSGDDIESLDLRAQHRQIALDAVYADPLIGAGAGTVWEPTKFDGSRYRTLSLDTPLGIVAKWGLLGGVAALVAVLRVVAPACRRTKRRLEPGAWLVAVVSLPAMSALAIGYNVLEDRGTHVMLFFLGAYMTAAVKSGHISSTSETDIAASTGAAKV